LAVKRLYHLCHYHLCRTSPYFCSTGGVAPPPLPAQHLHQRLSDAVGRRVAVRLAVSAGMAWVYATGYYLCLIILYTGYPLGVSAVPHWRTRRRLLLLLLPFPAPARLDADDLLTPAVRIPRAVRPAVWTPTINLALGGIYLLFTISWRFAAGLLYSAGIALLRGRLHRVHLPSRQHYP
jgi:hypothetical protein